MRAAALAIALALTLARATTGGAVESTQPRPAAECPAKLSEALTKATRPFSIVRSPDGAWQLYLGDLRSGRAAPFADAVKKELAAAAGPCTGNELFDRLQKTPQDLLLALAEGKVLLARDGLRVPPPPAEGSTPAAGTRAADPPGAATTPEPPQPPATGPKPAGESLWSIVWWIISVMILTGLLISIGLIAYKALGLAIGFFRRISDEYWLRLRDLSDFAKNVKSDLADVKDALRSMNAALASVAMQKAAGTGDGGAPVAAPLPRRPTDTELVVGCNQVLSGDTAAIAEFERWCDGRAYDRVPGAANELRADPGMAFDRSYFWYIETEGWRQGQLFPGVGIPLNYAGLVADDAGRLYKILEGVFEWQQGDALTVVAPAKVTRISQDRLQVRKPGVVTLPRR